MGRHFICVFMFLAMLAGAANAQMSEEWLKQEDAVWPIAKKACKDENAFKQLKDKASMGEPISKPFGAQFGVTCNAKLTKRR
jgi:hypothetical protein